MLSGVKGLFQTDGKVRTLPVSLFLSEKGAIASTGAPSQVDLSAGQRQAGRGLVVSAGARQRDDLGRVPALPPLLFRLAPPEARAAERVVGRRGHLAVQEVAVVVAHVPVAVSVPQAAERTPVGQGQPLTLLAADHPGLRAPRAAGAFAVALVVVAAEVVVVVAGGEGGEPRGVAAVALARGGPHGHPAGVGVAEFVALPGALPGQSHVGQLPGVCTRGRQRKRHDGENGASFEDLRRRHRGQRAGCLCVALRQKTNIYWFILMNNNLPYSPAVSSNCTDCIVTIHIYSSLLFIIIIIIYYLITKRIFILWLLTLIRQHDETIILNLVLFTVHVAVEDIG